MLVYLQEGVSGGRRCRPERDSAAGFIERLLDDLAKRFTGRDVPLNLPPEVRQTVKTLFAVR
jgi:hypothetical protein